MALITNIKRIEKEKNTVHKQVDTTYSSFLEKNGELYFQIDTYGSNDRQMRGKISQSVQLDKNAAKELIKLLKSEFKI
ncbi:hypothetical protein SAMN05216232_2539 [Virgibacillus subterraneus]|uniref:Methionyl-tRNA formyltransferase n=1 Tax=Virgibacillus subterraneus TaxID=621109 RepID=A0A1H9GB72_9BACI|nr:hypothetical protein [Virgibacillus subterraneus]SEQ47329.1 hypothetical protein SAMN05216232_2539 [Virgibacillus subterraneus]